jgi:uncharacterized protein (TIGR02996 family)
VLLVALIGAAVARAQESLKCAHEFAEIAAAAPAQASTISKTFRLVEKLEKAGDVEGAKDARLLLAKAVADSKGLVWPKDLADAEARELLWQVHGTKPEARGGPGLTGAMRYFRAYLTGPNRKLRERLGPVLAKELLRRGVLGDEQAFISAIAENSRDSFHRVVFADWLEEHGREASAQFLRFSAELERLPATRENLARRAELTAARKALQLQALREWQKSPMAKRLASVGTFESLSESGLPILRPRTKEALLASTAEQQAAIMGLDLSSKAWNAAEVTALTRLNLTNVTTLNLWGNRLGAAGATALAHRDSPFKNVTTLDLGGNQLGDAGATALAHRDSPFKNVTTLELGANQLGADGATALAHRNSPFKNVTTLSLWDNQLGAAGATALSHRNSAFQNVTTLSLWDNQLGAAGATALAHRDSAFQNVTTLDLRTNQLGAAGATALAHRDSPFKNVTTLDLWNNHIGDAGARALAHPDSPFKNVTTLELENNSIEIFTLIEVSRVLLRR